tara:strand:- start:432 stop:950 length:519 start_codon:yes stop_codon:yes gene_type:complete
MEVFTMASLRKAFAFPLAAIALSGCVSMSPEQVAQVQRGLTEVVNSERNTCMSSSVTLSRAGGIDVDRRMEESCLDENLVRAVFETEREYNPVTGEYELSEMGKVFMIQTYDQLVQSQGDVSFIDSMLLRNNETIEGVRASLATNCDESGLVQNSDGTFSRRSTCRPTGGAW